MTEADFLKEFIDWAQRKGKLSDTDFAQFVQEREARKFVAENFKGMF